MVRVATLAWINEILRGFDPKEMTTDPTDEPPTPSPYTPVCAPKKPRPHVRTSCAKAISEEDQ